MTVYTIGMFDDADPSDTDGRFNKYMNGVSSNYPNAEVTNWRGTALKTGMTAILAPA